MALMTPEQFEESLKGIKPRVFMNGKQVENILENRNTRTVIEANKASYEWALDPKYKDIMTCYSPLIDDVVNRYTYVSASNEDLVNKANAGTFTAEMLGTCIYRCVGYDAFHSLAATTWEMDKDLGTKYNPRFLEYLKMVQTKDLSVAGALTEPRGSRSKKTLDWKDPYLSLKIVDKNDDGIVVRGAKINISGAYASHEMVVMPNHFHLLLSAKPEAVKFINEKHRIHTQVLSKNIGTLLSSYTQAINKQVNRRGALFAHKTIAKTTKLCQQSICCCMF